MSFETIKALHIIFMVSWFAGLFYIVRLFIYHTEAQTRPEVERDILSKQFVEMEKKLWWIITTPAMILTVVFGVTMFVYPGHGYLIYQPWMHVKLTFVVLLLVYHFTCQKILFNLKNNRFKWTSGGLRIWNEVATLALVAIVFIVITKGAMNWWKGTIGFFGVAIGLMLLIKLYKRLRKT
ncbi:CopD family protein [Crocinitomicaceae bacterium CZZ-1]|uniref:Protoporphyrinogen IX oxidase n=1 Tax=Taishania pollutisoli TaxID=2766479 RepID=A0A8J6U1I9_9FLAO|nr:CopD family protein [Taishania pollutisoli]MBC9811185.1 CopD family protein [Taishania pollutisoli]MBX2947898.1 CopD family protein [Crocinitomicaceae bacterium]NGF74970.1 CopD family protein [Fluviicola sp. SGL-29]